MYEIIWYSCLCNNLAANLFILCRLMFPFDLFTTDLIITSSTLCCANLFLTLLLAARLPTWLTRHAWLWFISFIIQYKNILSLRFDLFKLLLLIIITLNYYFHIGFLFFTSWFGYFCNMFFLFRDKRIYYSWIFIFISISSIILRITFLWLVPDT